MQAKIFLILVIFATLGYIAYTYWGIKRAYSLAGITYTSPCELGDSSAKKMRLLIAGDSIGTGVGATSFEASVAGRISSHLANRS